jgi:hypothetical protein
MSGPPGSPLRGRRVVAVGLLTGSAGLVIALFLRAFVVRTPQPPSDGRLFWSTVIAAVAGLGSGMALEAVRQLQLRNPDPAYRRRVGLPRGDGR